MRGIITGSGLLIRKVFILIVKFIKNTINADKYTMVAIAMTVL